VPQRPTGRATPGRLAPQATQAARLPRPERSLRAQPAMAGSWPHHGPGRDPASRAGFAGRRLGRCGKSTGAKAVIVSQFAGRSSCAWPTPPIRCPAPGQVRVAVHAAGVNPVDAYNRADGSWAGLGAPCILGYDIAGVIDSLGDGVTALRPGDRVMAMTCLPGGAGGYAELAVVDAAGLPRSALALPWPRRPRPRWLVGPPGWCLPGWHRPRPAGFWSWAPAAAPGCSCCSWPPTAASSHRRPPHRHALPMLTATSCIDYTSQDVAAPAAELAGGSVDAPPTWSATDCWPRHCPRCGRAGRSRPSPRPHSNSTRCWTPTSPFTACSSPTPASAPATLPPYWQPHPVPGHQPPAALSQAPQAHQILERNHPGGKIVLTVAS
jgi:alcohol dehydrogenase-like protein